jgi:hypothetical protein
LTFFFKNFKVSWFKISPKYSYGNFKGNGTMSINGKEVDAKTTLYYEFRITSMKYKPTV